MKILKYLSFLLFLLAVFSCEADREIPQGEVVITPGTITALPQNSWQLQRPAGEANPHLFRMTWGKSRFAYENGEYLYVGDAEYQVEMDLTDNSFSNPQVLAKTPNLYADIFVGDLKQAIDILVGEETETPHNFSFRIKTVTSYGEAYSEPVNLTVTSYLKVEPVVRNIYMIGDMNGWDNTNKDYITFRNTNDPRDGVHTFTGYFPKDTYFKFVAEEDMGSYANMLNAEPNGVLKQGDLGAFFVKAGFHTITIDVINMTWKVEDYNGAGAKIYDTIGPIGGFTNWDNEPAMTQSAFDPHQWRITYTFSGSTALKFRGNHDWTNNWGGKDKDIPYGTAVFDGPGATVQDAGTYDIYFNDLTGHYAIKKH